MSKRNWHKELGDLALTDEDEAVAQGLLLSQSFGDSPDSQVRLDVAQALYACAKTLGVRGRGDSALRIAEEISSRFADDPSYRVQGVVAAALSLVADLQVAAGQPTAAIIATYDEALARVGRVEELTRRGVGVALLVAKAAVLSNNDRREEAIVVLDGALRAIEQATEGKAALRTRQAAMAIVTKLDNLAALDRSADAQDLGRQLSDVLTHVSGGPALSEAPPSAVLEPSEAVLAAALAEIINDRECWAVFEGRQRISPTDAAERACRLYGVSDPWAPSRVSTTPVVAASTIIRNVGDGYALLAAESPAADRSSLPLPQRALVERQLMQGQGIADWATALGHPLRLHTTDSDARLASTSSPQPHGGSEVKVSAEVMRGMAKCLYLYESAGVLSNSELGADALRYKHLRTISISYLRSALDWVRLSNTDKASDGQAGVAFACWLIAEGLFCATHSQTRPRPAHSPAEAPLRDLLHETGGSQWLAQRGISLPAWTRPANTDTD